MTAAPQQARAPRAPRTRVIAGSAKARGQNPRNHRGNAPRAPHHPAPPRAPKGRDIENTCKTATFSSPRAPRPYRGDPARRGVPHPEHTTTPTNPTHSTRRVLLHAESEGANDAHREARR